MEDGRQDPEMHADANGETANALESRRRKREALTRQLQELKAKIAQVDEKKKEMGGQPPAAGQPGAPGSADGIPDAEPPQKKPRLSGQPFKPRLMLTKTSAANRVWSTANRASPALLPEDTSERPGASSAATPSVPPVPVPPPQIAEPQTQGVAIAPAVTPLSREVSPFSEEAREGGEDTDGQGPAKRRRYPPTKGVELGRPTWLPEGWRVEEKVRGQGATAGTKDKYYFSPEGKRFRSRAEIQRFIESGALPTAPKKRREGDGSAPNSRPGTPGTAALRNRPFDANPEDIQRLLSGASAGPSNEPAVPKIPSRKKASGVEAIPGIMPPLMPGLDPRLSAIPQALRGQWPGVRPEGAQLWQPSLLSQNLFSPYIAQQMRPSLGNQRMGLEYGGRSSPFPSWQGPEAAQAYGLGGMDLLDFRRPPVKQKVKKVKVPKKRLVVADRFHLESLGKRLVKERLASLLQEGIQQRQNGRLDQAGAHIDAEQAIAEPSTGAWKEF